MRARIILCALALALGAASAALSLGGATATAGVGVATCHESRWCTVTASGDVTPTASQLAIGNVRAGTAFAITQDDIKHGQLGGQILGGTLTGVCAWSQYQRDWSALRGSADSGCPNPVLDTSSYVADGGRAVWTLCYPRCFGGVPIRFDKRCGSHGRTFCYSHDCKEYANYFPWTSGAHPTDAIRGTWHHVLDLRYLARYGDAQNSHPYYLVRDVDVSHGSGNWVFVSASACRITAGPVGVYRSPPRHR